MSVSQHTNEGAAVERYPMSAAMAKVQEGLDQLEELAKDIGRLPLEARAATSERMIRTLRILAGCLNETTAAVNKALFDQAYSTARKAQLSLITHGQTVLEELPGNTIADISFDRDGAMRLRTATGVEIRIRATTLPSGEQAIFASWPQLDQQLSQVESMIRPPAIRMGPPLRPLPRRKSMAPGA